MDGPDTTIPRQSIVLGNRRSLDDDVLPLLGPHATTRDGAARSETERPDRTTDSSQDGTAAELPRDGSSTAREATHMIPEQILKTQPYTIHLLDIIASNALRMNNMQTQIEDLTKELNATRNALNELQKTEDGSEQAETDSRLTNGDYYSLTKKKWITLTDEFREQCLFYEEVAQDKFKITETMNLPLESCIFREDGTSIKGSPIFRAIKEDAKRLILTTLAVLPDKPMQGKYRMLAFYKKYYPPQLARVCQKLTSMWVELAMCASQWKARAIVGRALRNLQQTSIFDYKTETIEVDDAPDAGGTVSTKGHQNGSNPASPYRIASSSRTNNPSPTKHSNVTATAPSTSDRTLPTTPSSAIQQRTPQSRAQLFARATGTPTRSDTRTPGRSPRTDAMMTPEQQDTPHATSQPLPRPIGSSIQTEPTAKQAGATAATATATGEAATATATGEGAGSPRTSGPSTSMASVSGPTPVSQDTRPVPQTADTSVTISLEGTMERAVAKHILKQRGEDITKGMHALTISRLLRTQALKRPFTAQELQEAKDTVHQAKSKRRKVTPATPPASEAQSGPSHPSIDPTSTPAASTSGPSNPTVGPIATARGNGNAT
ncbi:hypothetical protein A4X13_0g6355 [Tilletia indica]|uniref:Uncharacterized protein n=1 Tax=Tilletia indica TaxID=43049 RepID=A0A177TW49_9BASI|nr:hypothetical protein A4X13_0g6355 [Tilletia indica]